MVLVGVVCVWTVGVRVWEWTTRSRVRSVLSERVSVPTMEGDEHRASPAGIPLAELGLVGGLFSADEARREEVKERIRQLGRIGRACDQPGDSPLDFRQVLRELKVRGVDEMTSEAAAEEFLRRAAGVQETLRLFRNDLERGPWDWGPNAGRLPEEWPQRNQLVELFWHGGQVAVALTEAQWQSGSAGAGIEAMEGLRLAAGQAARLDDMVGLGLQQIALTQSATLIQNGITQGGWSDDQLAQVASSMPPAPTLEQARAALEAKKEELLWRQEVPSALEEVRNSLTPRPWGRWRSWEDFEASMAQSLITDAHIKDAFAVAIADVNEELSRIDVDAGTYHSGERESKPSVMVRKGAEGWERGVTEPVRLVSQAWGGSVQGSFLRSERLAHQAHIVAALELHRRQHGEFPASLNDTEAATGLPLPASSVSGSPYRYSREDTTGYRLWMSESESLIPP